MSIFMCIMCLGISMLHNEYTHELCFYNSVLQSGVKMHWYMHV